MNTALVVIILSQLFNDKSMITRSNSCFLLYATKSQQHCLNSHQVHCPKSQQHCPYSYQDIVPILITDIVPTLINNLVPTLINNLVLILINIILRTLLNFIVPTHQQHCTKIWSLLSSTSISNSQQLLPNSHQR